MKAPLKNKNKKEKPKKKGGVNKPKPKKEQVLVVAQEIKYARWLSSNDKKTRDRMLKALKKWVSHCFEKGYGTYLIPIVIFFNLVELSLRSHACNIVA